MQTRVSTATPHQTSARRCVTIRAMTSLVRMSKSAFNTNRRKDANPVGGIDPATFFALRGGASFASYRGAGASSHRAFKARWQTVSISGVAELRHPMLFALRTAHTKAADAVASAVLSGEPESKSEKKRLAAADISQRFSTRRMKELIAQPEPPMQLRRRLCYCTRPMLAREVCVEFGKTGILSERQQCNPRSF